jgi:hypothetical protein
MAKVQKTKNLVQIVTKKKQQMKLVLVRLIILIPEKIKGCPRLQNLLASQFVAHLEKMKFLYLRTYNNFSTSLLVCTST